MSTKIKRATITINTIANDLFPQATAKVRGYPDILEELQRHLQDKGDDPRYVRVVFAVDGQDKFVEITEKNIYLAGVFPRVLGVRYEYGQDNRGLRNVFSANVGDTLIVANNKNVAIKWEIELVSLGYPIRKI